MIEPVEWQTLQSVFTDRNRVRAICFEPAGRSSITVCLLSRLLYFNRLGNPATGYIATLVVKGDQDGLL
jgi:hypothetical protein